MRRPSVATVMQRLRGRGPRALVGTLVGNAPGFALIFAVTAHFGAGRITDAYAFAWSVALFGIALANTLLEANVLPAAQVARRAGRLRFRQFIRKTALQATVGAASSYGAIAILAILVVSRRGSWTPDQRETATFVIGELAALVVLVAGNSVCAAGLYALDEFLLPTFSQAFRGLLPLCMLPMLGVGYATITVIAALAVAGEAGRSLLLGSAIIKRSQPLAGVTSDPAPLPSVWRVIAPHAINMVIVAVNPVIDRTVASSLPPGSVTVVDLAEKVAYVPTLILMSSIVLVAGARWSAWSAEHGSSLIEDYRRTTRRALIAATALAVGFGVCVVAFAAISGRRLAGADTDVLEVVTLVLLAGLPAAAIASLGSRLLTSTRQTIALPAFAVAAVTLNFVGDVVGARAFGVVGIAGATVVMRGVNALLFIVYAKRLIRRLESPRLPRLVSHRLEAAAQIATEAPR